MIISKPSGSVSLRCDSNSDDGCFANCAEVSLPSLSSFPTSPSQDPRSEDGGSKSPALSAMLSQLWFLSANLAHMFTICKPDRRTNAKSCSGICEPIDLGGGGSAWARWMLLFYEASTHWHCLCSPIAVLFFSFGASAPCQPRSSTHEN